ncbi:MAG: hypothetical protein GX326_03435 [Clostridiaceae bacterium]|nr:hypothetical protein [Clostridiaceae bacterium]
MSKFEMVPFKKVNSKKFYRQNDSLFPRFFIVGLFLVVMLIIILFRTSILQLSSAEINQIPETVGQKSQMTVEAPRGDIVDLNGETLAYSVTEPMLYLNNADLSNKALNLMLLNLSNLMLENGVDLPDNLTQYFDYSTDSKSKDDKTNATFVFKKDLKEIERWQQNSDLFGLKSEDDARNKDEQVKLDSKEFYDYLLYSKFSIEDIEAGGNFLYTTEEAFQIMQMRYLILEHNWQFLTGEAILVGGPVNQKMINVIGEQNQKYAGALIAETSKRKYTNNSALFSHVLGYTGKISEAEYQNLKSFSYGLNDTVGKSGVELSAERYLHGIPGTIPYGYWQRNAEGEPEYIQGEGGVEPKAGNKVRLTLDKNVQEATLQALMENLEELRESGEEPQSTSAMTMNAKTGAVISMASIPNFHPQDFSLAQYDEKAAERVENYFSDNENKPMLNRAISEIYAPASTFKPFTACAALENNIISSGNQTYSCNGTEEIGYRVWQCYGRPIGGHGPLNLHDGMVTSCNLYFYKMGIDTGIDNLTKTFKKLGMGEYTNIDLPGEVKGIRPSPELKQQTQALPEDQQWFPADTAQSSIGQSFNSYTLVQLCRGINGIATGKLVQPHVIKEVTDENGEIVKPEVIEVEDLGFSEENIALIRDSMEGLAYNPGTTTFEAFNGYTVRVAMKTGTAEVQNSSSQNIQINSLFVCYAPADDPEIVFVSVVENTGKSGLSGVAKKVFDAYFGFNQDP